MPSTLAEIGVYVFHGCDSVKNLQFRTLGEETNNQSRTNRPGELIFPKTLKQIGTAALKDCKCIKIVWVEEDCLAAAKKCVSDAAVFSREATVGGMLLRDIRALRDVKIPEGVTKIEDEWFKSSTIESVIIPASV